MKRVHALLSLVTRVDIDERSIASNSSSKGNRGLSAIGNFNGDVERSKACMYVYDLIHDACHRSYTGYRFTKLYLPTTSRDDNQLRNT